MSQKVRKTLIMIVMAALIICLMAASLTYTFTYGRYAGGKFDEEKSPYDDLIEFVGAREYTVRSPEELIQAIKDGYSNIVIAEDAEEPFVITEGVTDVTANLVLNLNGKVVVRNSRNPMLDVQTNVSVVLVYDSKQTGAFYNPVGSSLMASGGSLTVGSGGYESGPRVKEYQGKEAAGTLGSDTNVTLFARSNKTNNETNAVSGPTNLDRSKYVSGYSLVSGVSLPTITPKTTQENNRETVRGNVYLSSNHSDWLPADTFLIYTEEENCFIGDDTSSGGVTFESGKLYVDAESEPVGNDTIITASEFTTPLCNVASCDFYYYYPISGTAGTAENPQDYAVIYGYWDVMALARDDLPEGQTQGMATALKDSGLIYPYAAVRMVEGEGIVRGGTFSNHFDAVNTYGIYAEGGTLAVSQVPVTSGSITTNFTTGGDGVCIRVSSSAGGNEGEDEGGTLDISGGSFSSEIGNTIEMKKSGGKGIGSGSGEDQAKQQVANQTAMIDMQGGELTINGRDLNSVQMTAGGDKNGGTLENVFGILAHGGGEVSVGGCTFNINGNYSAGVLSYDGTINLNDNTVIKVKQSDEHTQDGKILLTSSAVSSEASAGGDHPINMKGNVTITSNGLGITARGNINVQSGETIIDETIIAVETKRATGIYVNGGTFTVQSGAQISVNSTVSDDYAWGLPPEGTGTSPNIYNGVYVQGGSLVSTGTLNVTHTGVATAEDPNATTSFPTTVQTKSYAVYVTGKVGSNTDVEIGSGTINAAQAGGVYVENGAVSLGASSKTVAINTGGWDDTQDQIVSTQGTYASAVYAKGGTVTMNGTININSAAIGIVATAADTGTGTGAVTIESGSTTIYANRSTGVYIRGGKLTNDGTLDVTSTITDSTGGAVQYNQSYDDGNSAYKWAGADISGDTGNSNIYNGVYVKGGSLNSTGTLNVTFTGVQNDAYGKGQNANWTAQTAYQEYIVKSYAVRVDGGAGTNVSVNEGTITNQIGGGLYVMGVAPATIYDLSDQTFDGLQNTANYTLVELKKVTIQAQGCDENGFTDGYINGFDSNWNYKFNTHGGHAVEVDGGIVGIRDGTYSAEQGDGIRVQNGMVFLEGGSFTGRDQYYNNESNENNKYLMPGAAASYAFKVYGGSVKVTGGTFGKQDVAGSGAFVMEGTAYITAATIQAGGTTGFSAWTDATVTFAPAKDDDIQVTADSTGLAVEKGGELSVTIEGGTFQSTNESGGNKNGIWYGNGNAKLTITGGQFTGSDGSGLFFGAEPSGSNVQLSGGTYYGPKNDVSIETGLFGVIYSISNSINHNAIDGSANISYENLIMDPHVVTGMIEYSNQPSGPDYPPSPSVITGNGIQDHPAAMANGVATRGDVYYSMITISK